MRGLKCSDKSVNGIAEGHEPKPYTVLIWKERQTKLFNSKGNFAFNPSAKSLKLSTYKELDYILLDWFYIRESECSLSGEMIKSEALVIVYI